MLFFITSERPEKKEKTTYYDSIAHSVITVRLAARRTTFMCIVNYTKKGDSPTTESYNVTVKAGMHLNTAIPHCQ